MKYVISAIIILNIFSLNLAFAKASGDSNLLYRTNINKPLGIKNVISPEGNTKIKGYNDWKNEKLQALNEKINQLKSDLERKRSSIDPASIQAIEKQIELLNTSIEITKDLTVTDYFVGYLNKQADKKSAFKEASEKMTREEVFELMNAYSDTVNTNN